MSNEVRTQCKPATAAPRGPKIIKTQVLGKVKWFNENEGYGFIATRGTEEDVFFHYTAIRQNPEQQYHCRVEEGQKVQFDIVEAKKGSKAANITGLGGVIIQGKRYEVKNENSRKMEGDTPKGDVKIPIPRRVPVNADTKVTKVSKTTMTTSDLSQAHLDEFAKVKEQRARLKEEMDALKDAIETEKAAVKADFAKDLQNKEVDYQKKLESQQAVCMREAREQEARFQEELEALKNSLEKDRTAMKARYDEDLQAKEVVYQKKLECQQAICMREVKEQEARLQGLLEAQKTRFNNERESKTEKSWLYIVGGVCLVAGFLSAKFLT